MISLPRWKPFAAAMAGMVLLALSWDVIRVPVGNDRGVVSALTLQGFHPASNQLRYFLLLALPSLLWLFFDRRTLRRSLEEAKRTSGNESSTKGGQRSRLFLWVCLFVILWAVLRFVSPLFADLSPRTVDAWHEGESLSAAFNYRESGRFWRSSFIIHGLFYDIVSVLSAWDLYGQTTIGANRLFLEWLSALLPCAYAWSLIAIGLGVRREQSTSRAILTMLALAALFVAAKPRWFQLNHRDNLVFVSLGIYALAFSSRKNLWWFLAAFAVPLTVAYAADRGSYLFLLALVAFGADRILPGTAEAFKGRLFSFLVGLTVGWIFWLVCLGPAETQAFFSNLVVLLRDKDLMDGYILDNPFRFGSRIHSIGLLLTACQPLLFLGLLPSYLRKGRTFGIRMHLVLVVSAVLYHRGVLGRGDAQHLLAGLAPTFMALALAAVELLPRRRIPALVVALLASVVLLKDVVRRTGFILSQPSLLGSAFQRHAEYAAHPDEWFFPREVRESLPALRKQFESEPCSFVFTVETVLHYVVRKPSCTKYYHLWYAATEQMQHQVIRDLELTRPRWIVYDTEWHENSLDGLSIHRHLPVLDSFVKRHFEPSLMIGPWRLYRSTDAI